MMRADAVGVAQWGWGYRSSLSRGPIFCCNYCCSLRCCNYSTIALITGREPDVNTDGRVHNRVITPLSLYCLSSVMTVRFVSILSRCLYATGTLMLQPGATKQKANVENVCWYLPGKPPKSIPGSTEHPVLHFSKVWLLIY